MAFSPLISADVLQYNLDQGQDVMILDCRASLTYANAGRRAWQNAHLPQSQYFDLHRDMASEDSSQGRFPLPIKETFTKRLQSFGITSSQAIVLLDDAGGTLAAARAWWLLYIWAGHPNVKILDGGLTAWRSIGGQLVDSSAKITQASCDVSAVSDWTPSYNNNQLISAEEIIARPDLRLTDARSFDRFTGKHEPLDSVAGHIPGADCRPSAFNLTNDGYFKSSKQLRQELTHRVSEVVYCGGGVAACHTIFCYYIAGLPIPKLYIGSWSHWIRDKTRPIIRTTTTESDPENMQREAKS